MMYYFNFFIIFLATAQLSLAQQCSIEGFVFDKDNNTPLVNTLVSIEGHSGTIETDIKGYFVFSKLQEGNYTLVFELFGYSEKSITVQIKPGGHNIVNVFLEINPAQLREVLITGEFLLKEQEVHPINFISQAQIENSPSKDIGNLLRNTPDISGIRKGGGAIDPVIRGFKYAQLGVIINGGIKIEGGCPNRMDPAVAHIDVDDIMRIEVFKGPYALRFGPSFGGYINLQTIRPVPGKDFKTNVRAVKGYESNWNGNKEHLSISGGNDKIYFIISGNHKKYGNYHSGNGEEMNSGFTRYNYSARLGFSPWQGHNLILAYDRSFGRNMMFPALPMDERSDDTHLPNIEYNYTNDNHTLKRITFKAYHSDVHHIMDNKERPFSDTVVVVSDINATNTGGRLELQVSPGSSTGIIAGIDYEHITKDGQRTKWFILQPGLPEKKEDLWKDASIENTGIYIVLNHRFNIFNTYFSARVDRNMATSGILQLKNMSGGIIYENEIVKSEYTNFSLNTGISYAFNEKGSVGLSLGRGVRSPDMSERFIILLPIGYDNYDYLGNPLLKPETNYEADISFLWNQGSIALNTNTFFSFVADYITAREVPPSIVKPQTSSVLGVKQFYNARLVYLYGFEMKVKYKTGPKTEIFASAAATYGINPEATKYIIENNQVTGEVKVKNDPLPEIPPLEAKLGIKHYFLNNDLVPGVGIRFVSGQNKISQAYYEKETPGFALLDFNLFYKYNNVLSISSGIENLLNKTYYEHLNRRIIGTETPLYEPGRVFYINLILSI